MEDAKVINAETLMYLRLPAGHVKFLIDLVQSVNAPLTQTQPVNALLVSQYTEQFKCAEEVKDESDTGE